MKINIHSITAEYISLSRCITCIAQKKKINTEKPVMLSDGQNISKRK